MDAIHILLILVGISLPVGVYLWRESRYRNPASRWKDLAPMVDFEFAANPPRMAGQWKGRDMQFVAREDKAVLTAALRCRQAIRVEIGPREEIEKAAGMVVPDRVEVQGNSRFDERFVVRSTPPEIGQGVDPSIQGRLMTFPYIHLLAVSNRIDVFVPVPTEARELRDALDIASSIAELAEG